MNPLGSGVLAVRHAPLAADGLCVGDAEVPCTMAAEAVAANLRERYAEIGFSTIWSSPRSRCLDPARVLAATMGLPHEIDPRLCEINLGAWQGRPWAAIEATDPERYQAWLADWENTAPPGGETPLDLQRRVGSWWNGLGRGRHLLVAHAGVIRALRVVVQGQSWPQAMCDPVPYLQGTWFALPARCAE